MKCDETHPVCANCSAAERRCSFVDLLSSIPLSLARPIGTQATKNPSPRSSASFPSSPSTATLPAGPQLFSLAHLELLHHLETDFPRPIDDDTNQGDGLMRLIIQSALGTPYLMDQALAVASLHLSTVRPERRAFYRHQATELQTRALSLFNAVPADSPEANPLARFLFSSLLGQEIMYEAFSVRDDFHIFIEGIANCLSLHRGIRAVAGSSWPTIEAQIRPFLGDTYRMNPSPEGAGHECDVLLALIGSADLDAPSVNAIRPAVKSLQWAFDVQRMHDSHSWQHINLTMAWPVVVPAEFAGLVKQLRPEALVTLAYYAVILNRVRDFWVFGDVGQFMMHSIVAHLGSQWEGWLAWPKELLRRESGHDT
jgi:hypothetical protein